MVVIQFNAMMDEYQLERMSKMYAEQAKRGAIVLPAGAELVRIDEQAKATVEVVLPGIIVEEEELETEPADE